MQIIYMIRSSYICVHLQLKMCLTLFVQSSIFIIVVFRRMYVLLVHVCVPFLVLNICCPDAPDAEAVSTFTACDSPGSQLSADFADIKYMNPSVAWNSLELVVSFKLFRCVCRPHIGPNDTKIYFHILYCKRLMSVFAGLIMF